LLSTAISGIQLDLIGSKPSTQNVGMELLGTQILEYIYYMNQAKIDGLMHAETHAPISSASCIMSQP
jgi:hypothetical protein